MYTKTIIILGVFSIILQSIRWKKINKKVFFSWMFICCSYSWLEFAAFNYADPKMAAWEFSKIHITGLYFMGMTIEDFFFPVIFGIIFFNLHNYADRKINYTSPLFLKVFVLWFHVTILLFFAVFGGKFGQFQAFRMGIGLVLICFYTFNSWDLRQFHVLMIGIFLIAGVWDIWANCWSTPQQWFYRNIETLLNSNVYANYKFYWFKIGKGWFPLSIMPYYYVSGSVFTLGILNSLYKLFNERFNNEINKQRHK